METITRVYRTYELYELSISAQNKAYETWRNNYGYVNLEAAQETLRAFCSHFHVTIDELEYLAEDRPYVRFRLMSRPESRDINGQQLAEYLLDWYSDLLFNEEAMRIAAPMTGFFMDHLMLQPIYDFLENPDDRDYLLLMDECLDKWAINCAKDFKECTSYDYFRHMCDMKKWRFLENGRMF